MKVFCGKCKFFDPEYVKMSEPGACDYPLNISARRSPDNWKEGGSVVNEKLRHPKEINILNNCPRYEEK